MLEKLVVRNINSIGEAEMDFRKGNYKYLEENIVGNLVNPIALYGHNGSGKSAFLNALRQFINLLILPAGNLTPFLVNDFGLQEFRKNPGSENEGKTLGSLGLSFSLDGDRYEYEITTSRMGFIASEWLYKDGETVYSRDSGSYIYKGRRKAFPSSSKMIPILRVLASEEIGDSTIQSVYSYLSSFTFLNMTTLLTGRFATGKSLDKWGEIGELLADKSDEVKKYLKRNKDFPYYSIKKEDAAAKNTDGSPWEYYFEIEDGEWKGNLSLDFASAGMMSNTMLLSILLAVPEYSAIFIDELEAALHPSTIKAFLDVVREKKIQVVFSSHNTNILTDLRPDQVYFAKWKKGYSTIRRLSGVYPNIREVNNIEKMYLSHYFDDAIDGEEDA